MCGIAGLYSFKNKVEPYNSYLEKCMVTMKHRGPDDKGFWTNDENYSAAFVRLSIRDLSENGHQPMLSACGNYVLSFNGEIYNSENFIHPLKNKGVVFKSHSDTEVLLYSLIHFGIEKVLDEFDGMFAFAFYDKIKNKLLLARDRVGIKPLYIGFDNEHFIYSSQYDHIINAGFIKNNPVDFDALYSYLEYGYMKAGNAIYKNTMVVPQGHYISITSNGYDIQKYFDFSSSALSGNENVDAENIFKRSVQSQMVSDVPVGAFLSGGVDSPLINIWANELKPIDAFTIGNENPMYDESFYAKQYAAKLNIHQHFQTITENDFLSLIDDNFKAFSEPFADFSSIPTMLVSKIAREYVTVILSGDGPDEMFWGYERNVSFPAKAKLFHQSRWKLALKKISRSGNISMRYFSSPDLSSFYSRSFQTYGSEYWMPKVFKHHLKNNFSFIQIPQAYINPEEESDCMEMARWLEMNIHLQRILLKVDRSTMYYSLEARVPYLSNEALKYASSLNYKDCVQNGQGKFNTKKILLKYFPQAWVMKKKQGFLVPMKDWINKKIKDDICHSLLNMPSDFEAAFDNRELKNMLDDHIHEGKHSSSNGFIWCLYALVKWHKYHKNNPVLQ